MERKIRVGAVSYLNTKPLIYGFQQGMMSESTELIEDYPAKIAAMLINDEIDVGLVPVAIIPLLKEYYIVSDYCISCNGEVASVCLFSEVPVNEIKTILLDYQSRTSVALLKILLKEYWKISPQLEIAEPGYEEKISGSIAGLVIGDRAFKKRLVSKYIYDLGACWKQLTGMPFVFAAWIANKGIDEDFISSFNTAIRAGLDNLTIVVEQNPYAYFDLLQYYTDHISFSMDEKKMEALQIFLRKLSEL